MNNNFDHIVAIRIDKKDMINNLRALSDNCINLVINTNSLKSITLKDRTHLIELQTRQ